MYRQDNALPTTLLEQFSELEGIWELQKEILSRFKNVKIAFIILDDTNQGFLTFNDFSRRLISKGFPHDKAKHEAFFRFIDQNKDDKISLDDWNYGFQAIGKRLSEIKDTIVQHSEMLTNLSSPKQNNIEKHSSKIEFSEPQNLQTSNENSKRHKKSLSQDICLNSHLNNAEQPLMLSVPQASASPLLISNFKSDKETRLISFEDSFTDEPNDITREGSDTEHITRINFADNKSHKPLNTGQNLFTRSTNNNNPYGFQVSVAEKNTLPYSLKEKYTVENQVRYQNKENSQKSQFTEEGDLYQSQTQFDVKEIQEERSSKSLVPSLQVSINNLKIGEHSGPISLSPVVERYSPSTLMRNMPEMRKEKSRDFQDLGKERNKENNLIDMEPGSLNSFGGQVSTTNTLNSLQNLENKVPVEGDSRKHALEDKLNKLGIKSSPYSKPLPLKERDLDINQNTEKIEVWTARQQTDVEHSPVKEYINLKSHININQDISNNKEDNQPPSGIKKLDQIISRILSNQTSNMVSPERKLGSSQNFPEQLIGSPQTKSDSNPFESISLKNSLNQNAAGKTNTGIKTLKNDENTQAIKEKIQNISSPKVHQNPFKETEVRVENPLHASSSTTKHNRQDDIEASPIQIKEVDSDFLYSLPDRLTKGLKAKLKAGQALLENVYSVTHCQELERQEEEKKQVNIQEAVSRNLNNEFRDKLSPFKPLSPLNKITPIKACQSFSADEQQQYGSIVLEESPNIQIGLKNPSEMKARNTIQSTPGINIEEFESYKDEASREYSLDITGGWEAGTDVHKVAGDKFSKTMPEIAEIEEEYDPFQSQDKVDKRQKELNHQDISKSYNKSLSKDNLQNKSEVEINRNKKTEEKTYTEKGFGQANLEKLEERLQKIGFGKKQVGHQNDPKEIGVDKSKETNYSLQNKEKNSMIPSTSKKLTEIPCLEQETEESVIERIQIKDQPSTSYQGIADEQKYLSEKVDKKLDFKLNETKLLSESGKPSIFQESLLRTLSNSQASEKGSQEVAAGNKKSSLFQQSLKDVLGKKNLNSTDPNASSSQGSALQASKIENNTVSKDSIITVADSESKKLELFNEIEIKETNPRESTLKRLEDMLSRVHRAGKVDLNNPTNVSIKPNEKEIQKQHKEFDLTEQKHIHSPKITDKGETNEIMFSEETLSNLEALLKQHQNKENSSHKMLELVQTIGKNKPGLITTTRSYLLGNDLEKNNFPKASTEANPLFYEEKNHMIKNLENTVPKVVPRQKYVDLSLSNKETDDLRDDIQDNKNGYNLKITVKSSFLDNKQATIASPNISEIKPISASLTLKSYLDKSNPRTTDHEKFSNAELHFSSSMRDNSQRVEFMGFSQSGIEKSDEKIFENKGYEKGTSIIDLEKYQRFGLNINRGVKEKASLNRREEGHEEMYEIQSHQNKIESKSDTKSQDEEIYEALKVGLQSFNLDAGKEQGQKMSILEKLHRGKPRQEILKEDMRGPGKTYLISELARLEAVDRQLSNVSKSLRNFASKPEANERKNRMMGSLKLNFDYE